MTARAGDLIYRMHPSRAVTFASPLPLAHVCDPSVQPHFWGAYRRDHLDPCATGLCRYCRRPLPNPEPVAGESNRLEKVT
ncbi:hypothetical protein Gocc_2878 [Gaiella occulta]|uniref:Uncharacterized protein n=1 Tax=Gaiella occulta TaxID=1002870 RepID=A0A7M2YV30_9ACTN|nr:hypothetical protein [Gaiella occulta]RDI73278.1 hypothetical protein Gocc_2878 [Gaiella occulta]